MKKFANMNEPLPTTVMNNHNRKKKLLRRSYWLLSFGSRDPV